MDKFDYITATIEEEKVRVEKIIKYLKENNLVDELPEYQERYNNILKYLTAKERYFKVLESVKLDKEKLEELNRIKDEYEVDNILLEDTLLSKFNEILLVNIEMYYMKILKIKIKKYKIYYIYY